MQTENTRAITDFLFIENDIKDLKTSDLVIILSNNNIKGITTLFDELFKKGIINQHSQIIISAYPRSLMRNGCGAARRRAFTAYSAIIINILYHIRI